MERAIDWEEWTKDVVMAKRRVMKAARAETGRIGDPGKFLFNLAQWASSNGMEEDAALLREAWEANYA